MKGLKAQRRAQKLTRKKLADKIGMSAKSIANYEYGYRDPSIATLIKLADALHCSVDDIVRD